MFPRLVKLVNKLIPAKVSHGWNIYKATAALAALSMVLALVPLPQDLPFTHAATFTVDSTADAPDFLADGFCDTDDSVGDGPCTLRAAIEEASANASADIIDFDAGTFPSTTGVVTTIAIDAPLDIADTFPISIQGVTGNEELHVAITASLSYIAPTQVTCKAGSSPLFRITTDDHVISNLIMYGSQGDAIDIVDGGFNRIINNWIGTVDRSTTTTPLGNVGHGVCVKASTNSVILTEISGNIIVASGGDGIRLEGDYNINDNNKRNPVIGSNISNNLIGNVVGSDVNVLTHIPGNKSSGITLRIADQSGIKRNIITNNGFEGTFGDGITVLEAIDNEISENYIGTTQLFPNIEAVFPWTILNGGLDVASLLNIASFNPGEAANYIVAPNACDGVSIRFYDHVGAALASGSKYFGPCPDPDTFLVSNPSTSSGTYFSARELGPSNNNFFFNNDISSNLRNGVYVQALACSGINFQQQGAPFHRNLPNVSLDDTLEQVFTQSAQNSFIQNSIFFNDNQQPNSVSSGSGSYGIGIDLEDIATASLDNFNPNIEISGSYWLAHFGLNPDPLTNCSQLSPVEPSQPSSKEVDPNITENDDWANEPTADSGIDPDAGANRLQNTPEIDPTASTPDAITGSAPEGTLVELYQVICTTGTTDDDVPTLDTFIRNDCDTDVWLDGNLVLEPHTKGHGQGFRFLGNAYVAFEGDANYEGTWIINPADFDAPGTNFHDVAPFTGGLIVATATGVSDEELCWDDGSPTVCAGLAPASADVGAQRAGSPGGSDIWLPGDLAIDCFEAGSPASIPTYGLPSEDCFGSTSEFSAAALVTSAADTSEYSLTKNVSLPIFPDTTVAEGDTVQYSITLTNQGTLDLVVPADALADTLPSNVTVTGCTWITTIGTPLSGSCLISGTPLSGQDFGTIGVGGKLTITITTTVNLGLAPNECTIDNTVNVTGLPPITGSGSFEPATETGALTHDAATITVDPCGQTTGTGATFEKLVSINGGAPVDGDSGTPATASRGQPVTYLMHYTNNSGSGTGVFLTDTFPATGLTGTRTFECWINTSTSDTTPDSAGTCGYDTATGAVDSNIGAGGIQSFSLADGETLHVRVTGNSIDTAYPLASADLCNVAEIHTPTLTTEPASFSDNACVRVLDPSLVIYKSVLTTNSNPAGESSGSPGPQVPTSDPTTYYIDVANTGSGALTGLALTDTFPTGLGGSPAWTCEFFVEVGTTETDHSGEVYPAAPACAVSTTTGVITGTPTTIASGQVLRIRLSGRTIPTSAVGSTICNVIRADANLFSNSTSQACVRVTGPDLQIVKTASPTNPAPGGTVTYTLTVTNNGTLPALGVQIIDDLDDSTSGTDLIPACVSSIANVTPQDGGSTAAGNVVSWPAADLAAGASRTVHLTVTIRPDLLLSTSCRNVAVASGTNVTSDNDDADVSVQASVDFDKEVTNDNGGVDDPDVFELGDTVNYRLTIRNNTATALANLTTRDSIPEEEEDLRDVIATSGAVNNTELNNDRLEVNSIAVAGNGTTTVDYDVSVLEDNDFPLDNYDLDPDADQEDEDFYPVDVEDDDVENSDNDDPEDALGSPDGRFVSLGEDGEIIVRTSDEDDDQGKLIVDGDGDDFCILELDPAGQDNDSSDEEYEVEVSQTDNNSDYTSVGRATDDSDCFDLDDADDDITWARFVRIIDTSSRTRDDAPGADIDAVCILNLGGFVTNTASLFSGSTLLGNSDEDILVDFTDAFDDPLSARDCRQPRLPPQDFPLPPPPAIPPYVPPVQIPFMPFTGLPTTGPESTAVPLLASGVLGLIGWVMKRKGK